MTYHRGLGMGIGDQDRGSRIGYRVSRRQEGRAHGNLVPRVSLLPVTSSLSRSTGREEERPWERGWAHGRVRVLWRDTNVSYLDKIYSVQNKFVWFVFNIEFYENSICCPQPKTSFSCILTAEPSVYGAVTNGWESSVVWHLCVLTGVLIFLRQGREGA